jgi:hypothetical protein
MACQKEFVCLEQLYQQHLNQKLCDGPTRRFTFPSVDPADMQPFFEALRGGVVWMAVSADSKLLRLK